MPMRYLCLATLLLCFSVGHAQDLSGIWTGKLTQAPGGCFPEYNIELQINFYCYRQYAEWKSI